MPGFGPCMRDPCSQLAVQLGLTAESQRDVDSGQRVWLLYMGTQQLTCIASSSCTSKPILQQASSTVKALQMLQFP